MKKEELRKEINKDLEKIREEYGKEMKESKSHKEEGRGDDEGKNRENAHGRRQGEGGHHQFREGGRHMGGLFISKRTLWLAAGGALGALAAIGLGKASKKIKPAVVCAVKEGYAFKEWAAGKYEKAKEDVEDIVAEAKHAYHKDIEVTAEAVRKEKEILEKVEKKVEKKVRRGPKKEG